MDFTDLWPTTVKRMTFVRLPNKHRILLILKRSKWFTFHWLFCWTSLSMCLCPVIILAVLNSLGDLSSLTRVEPAPLAVEALSPNHWTTFVLVFLATYWLSLSLAHLCTRVLFFSLAYLRSLCARKSTLWLLYILQRFF